MAQSREVIYMKKSLIFITIVMLVLFMVLAIAYTNRTGFFENESSASNQTIDNMEFNLSDYKWEIDTFYCNKNVGPVINAECAISKAKELWLDKFGVIDGKPYDPIKGRPIVVAYDKSSNCWRINVTLPENILGAAPYALIQSDGEVLAVWMG